MIEAVVGMKVEEDPLGHPYLSERTPAKNKGVQGEAMVQVRYGPYNNDMIGPGLPHL